MGGGFVRTDYKIEPGEIIVSAVTTTTIASLAVTTTKIALSAITSAQIAPEAVYTSALQDSAVTSLAIGPGAVYTSALQDSAVTSLAIGPGAVYGSAIQGSAVGVDNILPSALTFDNLIALGSSNADATAGNIAIAHGLLTAPIAVWATPIAANALVAWCARVALKGITTAEVTFWTVSATLTDSATTSTVGTLIASTNAMNFVWGAHI